MNTPDARQFCIKASYQHRTSNETLEDEAGDYWDKKRFVLSYYCQYAAYQYAQQLVAQHRLKTVLDVGCGMGDKLVRLLSPHAKTLGIDQPHAIDQTRKRHPAQDFAADDFESPTGELGTFDLILSIDVIEHLLNPDILLDYIAARCNPKSYILLSTPERDVYRGEDNDGSPKPEHVREWNQQEFAEYVGQRFEVVEHRLLPAFRIGWRPFMMKEYWRLMKKHIPIHYCQTVLCRPK